MLPKGLQNYTTFATKFWTWVWHPPLWTMSKKLRFSFVRAPLSPNFLGSLVPVGRYLLFARSETSGKCTHMLFELVALPHSVFRRSERLYLKIWNLVWRACVSWDQYQTASHQMEAQQGLLMHPQPPPLGLRHFFKTPKICRFFVFNSRRAPILHTWFMWKVQIGQI